MNKQYLLKHINEPLEIIDSFDLELLVKTQFSKYYRYQNRYIRISNEEQITEISKNELIEILKYDTGSCNIKTHDRIKILHRLGYQFNYKVSPYKLHDLTERLNQCEQEKIQLEQSTMNISLNLHCEQCGEKIVFDSPEGALVVCKSCFKNSEDSEDSEDSQDSEDSNDSGDIIGCFILMGATITGILSLILIPFVTSLIKNIFPNKSLLIQFQIDCTFEGAVRYIQYILTFYVDLFINPNFVEIPIYIVSGIISIFLAIFLLAGLMAICIVLIFIVGVIVVFSDT